MAVDFKKSETKDNLMRAFAGESQARNRYTFAAGQAKKENLQVIEAVFIYTANQEKEHAEIFYDHLKKLSGETIHIEGGYPVDISDHVLDLLKMAQHNEY
ncbi:MAG: rubrerythrin family protein, partial [Lachnospiraceae bacterium]|nr:rubrerythrin family protein [Lachnospiraceae bacterium]